MDYKYINQLLERYWNCETSLEEEGILRAYQPSYANTSRSSLTNNWRRKRSTWTPTSTIGCWP